MDDQLRTQLESSLRHSYAIERELAGGGMSRVYVATERSLEMGPPNQPTQGRLLLRVSSAQR